ncbi:LacI family DNA-binding transcriptional regulator [Streptomyces sp. NPDC088719]|uniref:LacI family DNA-binding transcriptional regulator n=1 Tax=Streptomyces sp. NPDC088719 TaxID=3365872 RepID=UPI0038040087
MSETRPIPECVPIPPQQTTGTEIAKSLGVSQATISLVMANKWQGRVSAEVAKNVLAAAATSGYRPNLSARSLRLGRTGTVMLVVPSLTSPHFADVHSGAARVGAEHGIGVIVYPLTGEDGHGPFRPPRQAIDGVLAYEVSAKSVGVLRDGVALCTLDSEPEPEGCAVTTDVGAGMRSAVDHLIRLGHQHLLHIRAERDAWTATQRAEAFARQAAVHPRTRGRSLAVPIEAIPARDRIVARLRTDNLVTGVICDDDDVAACAYSAARELGLAIPGDLSIIGFNDLPIASLLVPALTTVRLPARELGRVGMEQWLVNGTGPANTVLPVTLVERASSAPPRP